MKKAKQAASANFPNTRKVRRRLLKKAHKKQPQYVPGRFVKRPADPIVEVKKKKRKSPSIALDVVQKERQKEKKEVDRLKAEMEEQRRKTFLEANDEEDKMIKKLEKQLGLNKVKNKKNFFSEDGLDYLLEICDRSTTEQIVAAEKHLANVEGESDFEEDLAAVTGKDFKKDKKHKKKQEKQTDKKNEDTDDDDMDEEIGDNDSDEELDENMGDMGDDDDEISSDDDDEISSNDDDKEGSDVSDEEPEEKPTKKSKLNMKAKVVSNKLEKKTKEKVVKEEELSKTFSEDEVSHLSGDDDLDGFGDEFGEGSENEGGVKNEEKPDVWEDIYGRKRDKDGNVIKEEKGIYIPPHLRNKDSTSDKEMIQLKRQIKSVLNKLTHTNLHWACASIENLYSNNSRHSVNSALFSLWLEAAGGSEATPMRLAVTHAALVAVLHANVATEIGAHFLEELTRIFDSLMQRPQPMEDKTLDNIVCCLAHLYNFKIYQAALLFDILARLLAAPAEKHVDCILAVFRCAGGALRRDAPAELRGFVQRAQAHAAALGDHSGKGSRIKFLLEVLMAVKNNNLNKIPNYDPSFVEQMKKDIRGVVRKGNYVTPLNITLEDLLKADSVGKWWVVGSAWGGAPPAPRAAPQPAPAADQRLLALARAQRMNTDIRRTIFCVIMSAEDYMDAFEKLQHLGLKGQQEREIVHVLLACCMQEKTYNPYYAVLGQKLCDVDRKYQLSIQFAVWDKIKDLESMARPSIANLAQFLIHLIMEKGLALSVLKIIQFSDLNKRSVKFLRQILLAIIMNADLQTSLEVFHRISKSPKLHAFRESLKLFIQHFLLKNAGKKSSVLSEEEMATLKQRTTEVEKILTKFDSKLKF